MKALIAINIIMGMVRLPSVSSYWSRREIFGNLGIKKVMLRNRFVELSTFFFFLHFNDSSQEFAHGALGYDQLFKVRPMINYV